MKDFKLTQAIADMEDMPIVMMACNVQKMDGVLGFSDTATDIHAMYIRPKSMKPNYTKCHVKVLNIGDTSNQSSSDTSLFKDAGRLNSFWNSLESNSKSLKVCNVHGLSFLAVIF